MVFRKGGMLRRNTHYYYGEHELEIVSKFTYLEIVFSTGSAFTEAQHILSGQSLKAIFMLNKYIRKFVNLKPQHILDLFGKLIRPILTYSAEVWGFTTSMITERVHLQFSKKQLGVKQCTQNDFVYGELDRTSLLVDRHLRILYTGKKMCNANRNKYIWHVYNVLLSDINQHPNWVNWVSLVRDLLSRLGFYYVWIQQGVGNPNAFTSEVRQRLTDNFVQNWNSCLLDSI